MKNKTNNIGRPPFTLTYPTEPFTLNQLFKLNRVPRRGRGKPKVCKLTVINHIQNALEKQLIRKTKETVQTNKVGRPAFVYELTKWGSKRLVSNPQEEMSLTS